MMMMVMMMMVVIDIRILAGFISSREADYQLQNKAVGTFLIRFSKSQISNFALAFVGNEGVVKHSLIGTKQPFGILSPCSVNPQREVYNNISEFAVAHRCKIPTPCGFQWLGSKDDYPQEESNCNSVFNGTKNVEQKNDDCVVCMDGPAQTVFLECGHVSCCRICSAKLKNCPICRAVIVRVVPIFR
jgi:hypothetical protein